MKIDNFPACPNRLIWSQIAEKGFADPEIASVLQLKEVDAVSAHSAIRASSLPPRPHGVPLQHRGEEAMETLV